MKKCKDKLVNKQKIQELNNVNQKNYIEILIINDIHIEVKKM